MNHKKEILMLGTYEKGGMREVVNQYLSIDFKDYRIIYIPTHVERNTLVKLSVFIVSIIRSIPLFIHRDLTIVHLHCSKKGSFFRKYIFLILAKMFRKKIILHTHGSDFFEYYHSSNSISKAFIKHFFQLPDVLIALSEQRKKEYAALFKIRRITVVPNFVSLPGQSRIAGKNKSKVQLLMLGRVGERKGTADLINIFKKLDNKHMILKIAGDGESKQYRKMVKALGLEEDISFLGWVDGKKKTDLFEDSDIFILPSYQEDLPMAILEAMSYGLPIVATNVAGIPSLVRNGYNGYLFEPGDINDCVMKLKSLIADSALRQKFGKNSLEMVKKQFEQSIVAKQIQGLYDTLSTKK